MGRDDYKIKIDLEKLLSLESSIKELQERDKEYQLFHENISQQINELISKLQNDLDIINNNVSLIQETINENVTTLLNHNNQLTDHNERLESLNSKYFFLKYLLVWGEAKKT